MPTFAEVFPSNDPVARFVVAMSIARNDIRHALKQAGAANDLDSPDFTYWIRVASGHFFEAEGALREWRKVDEVRRFIEKLPSDGKDALGKVCSAVQKMGPGALEHVRERTFHYPSPVSRYRLDEELAEALRALSDEEVGLVEADGFVRWCFADDVALVLAYDKHDPARLREQSEIARDGAVGFVNFAQGAMEAYFGAHGLPALFD
ncbi:MAG: hypothetical protein ABW135_04060 [Thermoleophilaceae bacterium]